MRLIKALKKLIIFVVALIVSLSPLTSSEVFGVTGYDRSFFSRNDINILNPTDVGCPSNGGTVTQLSGDDNRQKIWNYLTARGLSPEQTAGVMGNIQSESGGTFSPTINEFSKTFPDGGYGIVQWTGGRRDNLVSTLKALLPDLMTKYYTVAYSSSGAYTGQSQGFVSKNVSTGELMPVADNDALLLAELNFLVDESMSRTLHQPAVDKGYGIASETEWDVLKRQTTITDASNVWVYSFEIPASIDQTAVARAGNGQSIFSLYSNSASGQSCVGGTKQELAQQIIATNNLYYDSTMPAVEKQIIPDIASGKNNGDDWPCGLNIVFLKVLLAITKDHRQRVNSLNRACSDDVPAGSSLASRHYAGNGSAVDFGPIDNLSSYTPAGANLILKYLSPFLVNNSGIGQLYNSDTGGTCLPNSSLNLPSGIQINRFKDFCNHLHVDVPPNADPALQCKVPITYGGCDASQQVKG